MVGCLTPGGDRRHHRLYLAWKAAVLHGAGWRARFLSFLLNARGKLFCRRAFTPSLFAGVRCEGSPALPRCPYVARGTRFACLSTGKPATGGAGRFCAGQNAISCYGRYGRGGWRDGARPFIPPVLHAAIAVAVCTGRATELLRAALGDGMRARGQTAWLLYPPLPGPAFARR